MNPTLITANAVLLILILTLAPAPMDIYLVLSLYAANCARYFYRQGGRWGDDYDRTTIKPTYWQREEAREQLADNCLWYRVSLIFAVLFLFSAVVL